MRKSNPLAILLFAGVISSSAYALDLTPHEIASAGDGPPLKRYFFQDGGKSVTFRVDKQMTVNGAPELATFRFGDIQNAGMTMSKSSMKPEAPFDPKTLETYRLVARSFVPPTATEVQLDSETPDAVAINGWTSHQFSFTYKLFGFPYRRSVTFINYNEKEQIVVDISGSAADYEKTYLRGYHVLNSLSDRLSSTVEGPT